jgi:hypothetical protein
MRPPLVVIHLHRQEDADCVARALAALPAVDAKVEGRDVSVDMRSLGDVLNALHQCLVENDMTLVHIKIDDRTYAMEPATDGRELGFERCQPRLAVASNQAGLHRVVELIAVLAAGRVRAGRVDRALGEDGLECLFDEAFPVFGGLPRFVHSEDAVLVEAGAVMDESVRVTFGVDLFHASVVVDGAAVVAGVELDDVCIRHERLLFWGHDLITLEAQV